MERAAESGVGGGAVPVQPLLLGLGDFTPGHQVPCTG